MENWTVEAVDRNGNLVEWMSGLSKEHSRKVHGRWSFQGHAMVRSFKEEPKEEISLADIPDHKIVEFFNELMDGKGEGQK